MREQLFAMAVAMLLVSSSVAGAVAAQSNDVTWEGEVEIDGTPATDGAQYQYDITDRDAVGDFTINVTGSTATAQQTTSGTLSNGGSLSVPVDGNAAPQNANVTLTGNTQYTDANQSGTTAGGNSASISVGGNIDPVGPDGSGDPTLTVTPKTISNTNDGGPYDGGTGMLGGSDKGEFIHHNPPDQINEMRIAISGSDSPGSITADIYIQDGSNLDSSVGGTLINGSYTPVIKNGYMVIEFDQSFSPSSSSVTIDMESTGGSSGWITFAEDGNTTNSQYYNGNGWYSTGNVDANLSNKPSSLSVDADDGTTHDFGSITPGNTYQTSYPVSTSASQLTFNSAGQVDWQLAKDDATASEDPSITVDGETVSYSGILSDGSTHTETLSSLSTGSHTADASLTAGQVDAAINYEEVTKTEDPTVEVNGNTTSSTGTLADGETVSLSTDTSWVREGTNRVNVSAVDPGGSAPTPQVGVDYDHTAADQVSVSYSGETWSERYNISRTYSGDRANVSLSIPFASDRVVAVRDAEYQVNDGGWQSIPEADRSFDGSTLILDVGDVSANDTVEVRANGSKVRVPEGDIEVLQPTTEGDSLETEIQLVTWGDGSYIDVSGTQPDHYLHHAENESWDTPSEYARFSGGGQELYFPGASSGATARIETMPLDVDTTGDVIVGVEQSGYEPRFRVRPGDAAGDDVTFSWEHPDLATGTQYNLYSVSNEKLLASDTAESPVLFEFDDTEQTVEIFEENTTSSSTGGGGMWADAGSSVREFAPVIPGEYILIALLLVFGGSFAYSERRSPNRAVYRRPLVLVGGVGSIIVATIFIAPSAFFGPLQTALQATLPLLGIGAVGGLGLLAYGWYRRQKNESKPPTIEIAGEEK